MQLNLRNVTRLFMALTILVSVLVRPPGTMLVTQGDTLTYVLCTGGELETVRIALGSEEHEERDLSCDFFAAQVANLVAGTPDVPVHAVDLIAQAAPIGVTEVEARFLWQPKSARAPPLVI